MNPLELLWAALATAGFAVLFHLRPRDLPLAMAGAALGWWIFSAVRAAGDPAIGYFAAAAAIGVLSELGALTLKKPAFLYMVCAILPLVPGSGMYNTMLQSVRGDFPGSLAIGFSTLQAAGAIAAGLAVSSALARLFAPAAARRGSAGPRPVLTSSATPGAIRGTIPSKSPAGTGGSAKSGEASCPENRG